MNKLLENKYHDTSFPGSFSGAKRFYKQLRQAGYKVRESQVQQWLLSQRSYTLHTPARKRFPRNKINSKNVDDLWQLDLLVLTNELLEESKPFKYILGAIDTFSKYVYVEPLVSKTSNAVALAFQTILNRAKPRIPKHVQTDEGKEFIGKAFQDYLKKKGIIFYTTMTGMKAPQIERFWRTLGNKIRRFVTFKNSYKFIPELQNLVNSYNKTIHNTTQVSPKKGLLKKNHNKIWININGRNLLKPAEPKFQVNDEVRISKYKHTFEKGSMPNYTEETFFIKKVIPTNKYRPMPLYKIFDQLGNDIKGTFYGLELQKVKLPPLKEREYLVEKILKTRTKNRKKEFFVKFKGFPKQFNEWIPEFDLRKL